MWRYHPGVPRLLYSKVTQTQVTQNPQYNIFHYTTKSFHQPNTLLMGIVDSDEYSNRQILLLAQLLHINNLGNRDQIDAADTDLISQILTEYKNHQVMKLDGKQIKLTKKQQLLDLYDNLLTAFDVKSTVQLANAVYFKRIGELDNAIDKYKSEFKSILEE